MLYRAKVVVCDEWYIQNKYAVDEYSTFWRVRKSVKSDYEVRHVCPSVRRHGTTRLPLGRFSLNLILEDFSKICVECPSFIKIGQEWRVLSMKTKIHFLSHLAHFFLEWEMLQIKVAEKIKTHILCSVTLFENRAVYEKMWKKKHCRGAGRPQMAIWRMRISCWITKVTYTLRMCNTHCFSTAIMVVRPHLNVTLYVYRLSCGMLNLLVPQVSRRFVKVKQRVVG